MQMKKNALLALVLLVAMLFAACRDAGENRNSSTPSSQPVSSQESSEINDMFPESDASSISSEMPVESGVSSEEDTPAAAQPIEVEGVTLAELEQFDPTSVTWGPGRNMDEQNRPTACVQLQESYGEHGAVFLMPEEKKKVYLTFDEGYENGYTAEILDVLKEKECPAVFFVTMSYATSNTELIQRMIDEGHVVANHSVNHKSMPDLDSATAVEEIAGLHNYMVEHFNYQMSLFRPPEGKWSERSLEIAKALDYKTVLWSFAYKDYDVNDQPEYANALERVSGAAHPGAVYLLHAVSETNTAILGEFIDTLRGQGYTFEKLQ